jgi:SAM-dependent methyltransferase
LLRADPTPRPPLTSHWSEFVSELKAEAAGLDEVFDAVYPIHIRKASKTHWTPVEVAKKAVELLAPTATSSVLDVGSGAGKFCVVSALLSPASFVGVEQRPELIRIAQAAAEATGATGATFLTANAFDVDWRAYTGLYLYNPFQEQLSAPCARIDGTPPHSEDRYREYIALTTGKLGEMPEGTRVVLYQGFGGELPEGYQRDSTVVCGDGALELWIRI